MIEKEEFVKKLQKYCKKHRVNCKNWCGSFNTDDNDCELYGIYKDTPSSCYYYLSHTYDLYKKNSLSDKFLQEILTEK